MSADGGTSSSAQPAATNNTTAKALAADILGENPDVLNLNALSAVTFTDPEIGSVGMTDAAARGAGLDVEVVCKPVEHTARGWLHGVGNRVSSSSSWIEAPMFSSGRRPPARSAARSLVCALAVHARIPISTLRSMIYAHPTFHKGIEDALNELPR